MRGLVSFLSFCLHSLNWERESVCKSGADGLGFSV